MKNLQTFLLIFTLISGQILSSLQPLSSLDTTTQPDIQTIVKEGNTFNPEHGEADNTQQQYYEGI